MILWFVSADFVLNQFCFNKVLFIGSYLGSTTTQLVFDFWKIYLVCSQKRKSDQTDNVVQLVLLGVPLVVECCNVT